MKRVIEENKAGKEINHKGWGEGVGVSQRVFRVDLTEKMAFEQRLDGGGGGGGTSDADTRGS